MKTDFTVEMLDANRAWMRRLAAALVRDAGQAEDLEQGAWEAALRHPPRKAAALRPWLRKVLLNRLRNEARAEARRRAREAAAGWQDSAATPEEVAARLELQRRTCVLVAGLDQPHRQVVYLRFFEDRDSPEIARLLGIPEGTVRWRLKTALDELRALLDRESQGDRSRWRALMLPLAAARPGPAGAGRGRAQPRDLIMLVAVTVVAIGVTTLVSPGGRRLRNPAAKRLHRPRGLPGGTAPLRYGPPRRPHPT